MAERLIAIVGPTASGKSELAMRIAREYEAEIVCADSRTIYKGMDIGTAKPSHQDQAEIRHHLLDVLEPNQPFSAAEFKELALAAIQDIQNRGKLPILVGGSGLYVYAVAYDYQFPAGARTDERAELEKLPLPALVRRLHELDADAAERVDLNNPRRVIRAIETAGQPRTQATLRPDTLIIGLNPSIDKLEQRIAQRTEWMLGNGLIEEAIRLRAQFGNCESLNTVGYRETSAADINLHTRQLVKRQITWFKRNPDIEWFEDTLSALPAVREWMA